MRDIIFLKTFIKSILDYIILQGTVFLTKLSIGQYVAQKMVNVLLNIRVDVEHNSTKMCFSVPNKLTRYRVDTFSTKEPETLEWIDSFSENSVLWDIGANIGLYSIYAAKKRDCQVCSFEPSVFNLELLARNIYLNKLQEQVTIIPIALNDKVGVCFFKMSNTDWGGPLCQDSCRVHIIEKKSNQGAARE